MSSLAHVADDIVYGQAILGLALVLVMLEVVVLGMAVRRRKQGVAPPSLKLHAVAGAAIIVLPVLVGLSVRGARALMVGAIGELDPSAKAMALSRGMAGQISGIAFAIGATGLALLIWVVGFAYTASAPQADGRARSLPPVALVAAGLLPTALGALRWTTGMIRSFAAMAGAPPEDKTTMLVQALDAARGDFREYARVSTIAIPVLAVVAIVLIVRRDLGGASARPARAPAGRGSLIASGAALLLAALILRQARPLAAENTLPWPATDGAQITFTDGPPAPELIGPDPVQLAPVVLVHRDHLGLDGTKGEDLQSLEEKLVTLRQNYRLLHPGDVFNGIALVVADAGTPTPRLFGVLKAIRGADYHQPLFAFTKDATIVRPVLGTLKRGYTTAAAAGVVYSDWKDKWGDDEDDEAAPWKNGIELRAQDFGDYAALARRLVELRRQGKAVVLKVERDRR